MMQKPWPFIEFKGLGFVLSADYPSIQTLREMDTDLDKPSLKLIRNEILPKCAEMAYKYGGAWDARLAFLTGLQGVREA
jgi:hypothetical protein